jgi:aspartate kinase
MVVLKFGGSSVADAPALARVCAIVACERRRRVVVVSALAGVTDTLLEVAQDASAGRADAARARVADVRHRHAALAWRIHDAAARDALLAQLDDVWAALDASVRAASALGHLSAAASDAITASGELASSRLVAAVLAQAGMPAVWVDARTVVATDARHTQAVPVQDETAGRARQFLRPLLDGQAIPVLGGFVGAAPDGATTTLGRGGSDFSAALIGACLDAEEIQIWTDVDGMLTADPRVLRRARPVARLSFDEASALAHFGARVLHPATVRPAYERNIAVRILNSRRPAHPGTVISRHAGARIAPLAGLACLTGISLIDVALPGGADRTRALAGVFEACAAAQADVYLVALGDTRVSIAVGGDAARLKQPLDAVTPSVVVHRREECALLAVVGAGLANRRVRSAEVLAALDRVPLHAVSESVSEGHVAVVLSRADLSRAVACLHARFFEGAPAPLIEDGSEIQTHVNPAGEHAATQAGVL